jgi:hypothetical protein
VPSIWVPQFQHMSKLSSISSSQSGHFHISSKSPREVATLRKRSPSRRQKSTFQICQQPVTCAQLLARRNFLLHEKLSSL